MNDAGMPDPSKRPADRLDLDRFLPYRLSVLTNVVSGSLARIYADRFGLSVTEWRVMAVLGTGQPPAAVDICAKTAMDKVQVSRTMARLISRGLVMRAADHGDRRRAVLRLSADGDAMFRRIAPLAVAYERRLVETLSAVEVAQLDGLLAKLLDGARTIEKLTGRPIRGP